jgi:phenylacetic acid degradation operon negative regulatory protein
MANTARSWINAESKVGAWSGRWLVAHTAHLGRANKTAVRSREGSFRLSGFAALVPDLWCRPANLKESLQQTKDRLVSIGLERQAVLMSSDEISGIEIEALFQLWPIAKIESGYSQAIETMDQSRAKLGSMDVIDAARETFLVGESVIRQINADPLLPDEMIDSKCRRQMISEMKQYNELGWIVWEEFQLSLQS